jgi:hypothetical protein
MADQTTGGEWKWRVIFERSDQYRKSWLGSFWLSFSRDDDMPIVGRKYHMACHGVFRIEDGIGIINPQ